MSYSADFNLLIALSNRDRFKALRPMVPDDMFDPNTLAMLSWFEAYYREHPEHVAIDTPSLMSMIRLRSSAAGFSHEQVQQLGLLVERLDRDYDPSVIDTTVSTLEYIKMSGEAANLLQRYNANEEVDLLEEMRLLLARTEDRVKRQNGASWANEDPLVYFEAEADDSGLQWSQFPQLQSGLKGLRAGDNVALAAPTDAGKTSLLCRFAAGWAEQVHSQSLYDGRPLLYLVNEGTQERITTRMYQTVLQKTFPETLQMARAGTLKPAFDAAVGPGRIRVTNIHGLSTAQVSRIIDAHNPYLVISDMTGRIRAPGAQGMNDISQLEYVWNTMRELATLQQFIHMGTVQVSAEGFDMLFPPISALQNSKTGIQTTLDLLLMMGFVRNDSAMHAIRGISTPKNKLARAGVKNLIEFQAVFDPHRNAWDAGVQGAT